MKQFTNRLASILTITLIFICFSKIQAQVQVPVQTHKALIPEEKRMDPLLMKKVASVPDSGTPKKMLIPGEERVDYTVPVMLPEPLIIDTPRFRSSPVKVPETAFKGPRAEGGPKAAPGNDDICSARSLPLNGGCLNGQTNIEATGDYYGGCVPVNSPSVWYTFTLTGTNTQIDIDFQVPGSLGAPSLGQGSNVLTFLMRGSCSAPDGIQTMCGPASQTFHFDNLTPGIPYYLLVATAPGSTGNFNICGEQSVMPLGSQTGPEQDCAGAIPLCNNTYSYVGSYYEHGSIQEVATTTCLHGGETNSIWYVFTCQTSGTFAFTINTTKDYDFALYNLTSIGGCTNVPSSTPIRCNFSADYGVTGLTLATPAAQTELPAVSYSASQDPTMPGITNMTAGNTYALIVDNWTGDNTGFSITFSGTAVIYDATPPTMTAIAPDCNSNNILLTMSEPVQCLSVQQNDFRLVNTATSVNYSSAITQILGYNCPTTGGALTSQLVITHNGSLPTGPYQIVINPNPSLADKCGNKITAGSTINFNYLGPITLSPVSSSICAGASASLNADGADGYVTYTLNPGGLASGTGVFSVSPIVTTNYNVTTSTYGGCTRTATATVNVEGNIITTISPASTTVCDFTTPLVLTATTTINGVACGSCTYLWSTGATTASISVNSPGTYTVTATTGSGCTNGNSPSTTLSLASSGTGGGSCDVIYVSRLGGGTGLTKDSPTTLANAIALAQCTYTTIKMQKDIYTLSDYQVIHSFVTLEGGYDNGFTTKYSDMSGGTNSTTIRRSNAADSDNTNTCTCFRVDDGAMNFRIQDIRIELPGSTNVAGHTAGTNRTNYGIKLGAACTGYNIVRCYIDAGVGSAP